MNKQDIQAMKENREAFKFWPKEWQDWAENNWREFCYCDGDSKMSGEFFPYCAYRLRADYELPEEKWYFNNRSQALEQAHGDGSAFEDNGWIEVPANLLEYVRKCLKREGIGEYELRLVEEGGEYMSRSTSCSPANTRSVWGEDLGLRFVRKKKKAGWTPYEIVNQNGILIVPDFSGANRTLSEAIDYAIDRGMCPQFQFVEMHGWHYAPNADDNNDKPATLVKMRVWE